MALPKPLPVHGAVPHPLDLKRGSQELGRTAVPLPGFVAVLDLLRCVILPHDAEASAQAAPVALDADRGCHRLLLLAPRLEVPVTLLQGDGGSVIEHTKLQPPQHHVEQHHREDEGAMVVSRAVGHLEEFVGDGDVAALADSLAIVPLSKNGIEQLILVAHKVAHLLHQAHRRVAVEEREDAGLRKHHHFLRHYLLHLLHGLRGLGRNCVLGRLLGRGLGLPLGLGLGGLGLGLGGRGRLLRDLLGLGLNGPSLGLHLRDVCAHLRCEGGHCAMDLGPVQGQLVVHLTPKDLHQLGPGTGVEALELEMIVCGELRRVQRLPHSDKHLGGEVHMPMVRGQSAEYQARQALVGQREQPIVVVLDCGDIVPERCKRVSRVRWQLLADGNELLWVDSLNLRKIAGLVSNGVAGPLHRGREEIRRDVREQVPRDREQHVRGEIRVLALMDIGEVTRVCDAQTPSADLLIGKLAGHGHQSDGALHGSLDLLQDLLDVRWQVAPPGMHKVAQLRTRNHERHQHGAGPLVGLALLTPQEDHILVVAVAPPVPLDDRRCGSLELPSDDVLPLLAERLQLLVDYDLDLELGLKATPVGLDLQGPSLHLAHLDPGEEALGVGLDPGGGLNASPIQIPQGHTPPEGLDLRRILMQLPDRTTTIEATPVGLLDALDRVEQDEVASAAHEATEAGLEARSVAQHEEELLPCGESPPAGLHP
mmetsp:Transcript_19323/g.41034  ORF Transcript_19323/g.41034 Transcript_19323/m.41034 type:complete len:707 (-) Transcript_19323:2758-4878(-)